MTALRVYASDTVSQGKTEYCKDTDFADLKKKKKQQKITFLFLSAV